MLQLTGGVNARFTGAGNGQCRAGTVHGMAMHVAKPACCGKTCASAIGGAEIAAPMRRIARSMYWQGWKLVEIERELEIKYATLASWKRRDEWDKASPVDIAEDRVEAMIARHLDKEPFTEGDMKRVDFGMRMLERGARIRKYGESGKESDLNPKIARRNDDKAKAKRAEKRKNFLTIEQWQALLDDFEQWCFAYQWRWWENRDQRTRKLRKARQIGATTYFAREAIAKIADAVIARHEGRPAKGLTFAHADPWQPRNQIFLSASERQALKFRRVIVPWVMRVTGVELKGKIIMIDFAGLKALPSSSEAVGQDGNAGDDIEFDQVGLYFLSTNSATAQGESGDFYFDEFAWVANFAELLRVASAMATHKIYKKTLFSTPSTKAHASFDFWSGAHWNKGRTKADQRPFDVSHRNLRHGAIMPDGSWQQIVTIHDAVAEGLGALVDVAELRSEYSEDEFRNLFDCEDIDDSQSSFPWARIAPARVDSFYKWRDFKPALLDITGGRPFGDKPVWLGYDPNKQGRDDAALMVVAPPDEPGTGKFRLLDKYRLNGLDFQGQSDFIRKIAARYNVTDIGIDASGGIGAAVLELVQRWFPTARKIEYSVAVKTALVVKAQNLFRAGRVEFDAGWTDFMQALMAIHPTPTGSGKNVTYTAARNGEIGHADLAWAFMHAVSNEPLDVEAVATGAAAGRVVFSD